MPTALPPPRSAAPKRRDGVEQEGAHPTTTVAHAVLCSAVGQERAKTELLFGIDVVSDSTIEDVAGSIVTDPDEASVPVDRRGVAGWRIVVTPNVDQIVRFESNRCERAVAEAADLALPDGMPVVWASRLLGRPLARRLAGSDLFVEVWRRLIDRRLAVVVVAPTADVARRLEREHPLALCFVATVFAEGDEAAADEVVRQIVGSVATSGARLVVISLAAPKAYLIADRLMHGPSPEPPIDGAVWVLLLGASAEFHTGVRRRAPSWMQRAGLEWLHRWAHDPRRLTRRYLGGYRFVGIVWREWRTRGRR